LEAGLRVLEGLGWVRLSTSRPVTGGTLSEVVELHPNLRELVSSLMLAA